MTIVHRIRPIAAFTTVAAMIATPLMPPRGRGRRTLSSVVVTGLFTTTASVATRRWGGARVAAAAASVTTATALVERIGTRTGLPFGRYAYTPALRPQLHAVPVIVPLAWFAMALPAREAAHAALGTRSNRPRRIVLGAAAMTAWDLFLDPQMVGEGYWRWQRRGRYRGIPASNFAGWFVTSLGVMALLDMLLPTGDTTSTGDGRADTALVAEYAGMGVMETVGFAAFFRDRMVAAVGGAGMVPLSVVAVRSLWRARHARRTDGGR